jgi:hypothetical protein
VNRLASARTLDEFPRSPRIGDWRITLRTGAPRPGESILVSERIGHAPYSRSGGSRVGDVSWSPRVSGSFMPVGVGVTELLPPIVRLAPTTLPVGLPSSSLTHLTQPIASIAFIIMTLSRRNSLASRLESLRASQYRKVETKIPPTKVTRGIERKPLMASIHISYRATYASYRVAQREAATDTTPGSGAPRSLEGNFVRLWSLTSSRR